MTSTRNTLNLTYEKYDDYHAISINWVSTEWEKKKGQDITTVKSDPETFRFFVKLNF